jgi:serine/threonine-protein kinase Chk2
LADFGLAKIIGEESFTTTLCGTPSYVAPEILQPTKKRRYTRAVDIWSLGVVLYICLCGFPPFSDELYSPESPYTLAQQILGGRYDYPSPYWDSVGDPALMLIDRMLTVDPDERIAIDECLEHPWVTGRDMGPAGESVLSTDGLLAGRMDQLDFSKRKPLRERTLLSTLNDVHVRKVIAEDSPPRGRRQPAVTVFEKNRDVPASQARGGDGASQQVGDGVVNDDAAEARVTAAPSAARFLLVGDKGDESMFSTDGTERLALFKDDSSSVYPAGDSSKANAEKD